MIPHTPILLVGVAHALARHATRLRREHPELPCSLEFVASVGVTSHLDLEVGLSTWPIRRVTSFDDLRRLCARRRWARQQVEPGDLLLMRHDVASGARAAAGAVDGARAAAGACAGENAESRALGDGRVPDEEVAVVLEVLHREAGSGGNVRQCLLAVARPHDEGGMQVETHLRWCDTRGGDLAIRWYATIDDVEHAA